jgi:hypothetical protein
LKIKLPLDGQLTGKIINFEFSEQSENISSDKILLGVFKKFSGGENLDVSKEFIEIASFYLEKDNGIVFEWNKTIAENRSLSEPHDRYNRILLADLQITVGNYKKVLTLFEPKSYETNDVSVPRIGKSFNTWEGGRLIPEKDKIIIVAKNGEFETYDKKIKINFSIEKFISKLPNDEEEKNKKFELIGYPTQITYSGWQYEGKDLQGALIVIKGTDGIVIRSRVFKAKINSDIKELDKELGLEKEKVLEFARKYLGYGKRDKFKDDTIQTIDSQVKNNNLTEWSSVKANYTASKGKYDVCNKLLSDIETFEKGQFHPIPFSIYLLKSGTKPEDIDKPENWLLLLEVKSETTEK